MSQTLLHTQSGSVYEFDLGARCVRRLGNHAGLSPTRNQGRDGDWRALERIAMLASPDGVRVQILWGLDDRAYRSTLLSAALDPTELAALEPLLPD